MKREHQSQQVIPPPFSENLIFWAPLTQGDLTDHISGLVPDVQGSATWDSNEGRYLLDSTQNSQWKAALQYTKSGGFNVNCVTGYTMCAKIKLVSSSWVYNALIACTSAYLRNNGWTRNKQCFAYANETSTGITADSTEHLICFTAKAGDCRFYVDGVLVSTASGYTQAQQVNPPTQVDVCASNTNSNRIRMYARDVRLYDRILSASEVAQL